MTIARFSHLLLLAGLGVWTVGSDASAAAIAFNSAADYDNNFYETTNPAAVSWSSSGGGQLQKISGNSATTEIYNTTATGGVGGSGGTGAATLNNNTFGNLTLQMDFSTPELITGGDSLGFFARVNSTATSGYFAVFRLLTANTADFRLFDTDSNPTTGTLPTAFQAGTITSAGSFATGTFYTFRLDVLNVGSNVQFTGSVFTQGGTTQLGNSVTLTDTTSPVQTAGQVGLRLGSNDAAFTNLYDNFAVVPEPASGVLLAMAGVALGLRRKRK
jgi:hypothetical protein